MMQDIYVLMIRETQVRRGHHLRQNRPYRLQFASAGIGDFKFEIPASFTVTKGILVSFFSSLVADMLASNIG